ncbi:DUF4288 domain-containing protein [Lysobacter gummosus]|uniref:DUF4288 domain-containing protein n=1 Tax=Lysobacter gummosus TaxID=262324 RepID=UPI00362544A4
MTWFAASALFEGRHTGKSAHENLWQESIYTIQGISLSDAEVMAREIAISNEHSYQNSDGEEIKWTFVRLERIYELQADVIENGTEIFSRFLKASEVASFSVNFDDPLRPL